MGISWQSALLCGIVGLAVFAGVEFFAGLALGRMGGFYVALGVFAVAAVVILRRASGASRWP